MINEQYSTDKVAYNKLKPHGRVNFSVVDGNIVIYHALGPFNAELFTAFQSIEPEVLKQLKSQTEHWVEIVVFEKSCLALNEFISNLSRYLQEMKKEGLVPRASAYVIKDDIDGALFMTNLYQKCYESAGLTFQVFEDELAAISWVKSFL